MLKNSRNTLENNIIKAHIGVDIRDCIIRIEVTKAWISSIIHVATSYIYFFKTTNQSFK